MAQASSRTHIKFDENGEICSLEQIPLSSQSQVISAVQEFFEDSEDDEESYEPSEEESESEIDEEDLDEEVDYLQKNQENVDPNAYWKWREQKQVEWSGKRILFQSESETETETETDEEKSEDETTNMQLGDLTI